MCSFHYFSVHYSLGNLSHSVQPGSFQKDKLTAQTDQQFTHARLLQAEPEGVRFTLS